MTTFVSEDYIEVSGTNDGTGQNKKLETIRLTDGNGDTVHREGVFTGGIVNDENTTTTPLATSATYTGDWARCPDGMTVSMKTDQPGTLYFDFSNDAVNSGSTFPVQGFRVAAGIHEYHNAKVNGRYCRVRLVNDADGDQTAAAAMVWFKAVTSNKAKTITLKGYSYSRLVGSRYEIYRDSIDTSVTLESSLIDPMRFRLTARDVLYFTATAGSGGQGDVDVVGRFSLNLYDNT